MAGGGYCCRSKGQKKEFLSCRGVDWLADDWDLKVSVNVLPQRRREI